MELLTTITRSVMKQEDRVGLCKECRSDPDSCGDHALQDAFEGSCSGFQDGKDRRIAELEETVANLLEEFTHHRHLVEKK